MRKITLVASLLYFGIATSQNLFPKGETIKNEDSLKGSNTSYRDFWDVKKYELSVEPNFEKKTVSGSNLMSFEITKDVKNPTFQIDLQQPMEYQFIGLKKCFTPKRKGDFIFIETKKSFKKGEKYTFNIKFSGNPKVAKKAPWDGGWVFSKDQNGNPFMSVAQEGIGVSLWLPTKDLWSDEPDQGIVMKIITPKDLVGVGNGRLIRQTQEKGKNTFTWEVKNAINPYSIVPNVGKYVNFKDSFDGEKGKLDLDYWVLDYQLEKAKKQFQQVKPMMQAFEYWFGAYPFYEDSYKLVESPYLGMEHQSNVAYGNHYENGYLGRDLSGTGVGLNWDFIIIHESGHEWFANNITAKDQADMWIHESFTAYSETLFTEKYMDKNAAETYVRGTRQAVQNDIPIIGKYGIRNEGSGDMYYKGANMLHTIRQVINDDEKFRQILRGLNKDFYHQTVTTQQIENYISTQSGIDFSSVFDQYLRTTKIPTLEYSQTGNQLKFRYQNSVKNLKLPIRINGNQEISPTEAWQTITLKTDAPVVFNPNYYIDYSSL
ncbi:M1 family peptidase [Kaistella haifensis]|nr:M1 family peptidase [Kaistella haifensis]